MEGVKIPAGVTLPHFTILERLGTLEIHSNSVIQSSPIVVRLSFAANHFNVLYFNGFVKINCLILPVFET